MTIKQDIANAKIFPFAKKTNEFLTSAAATAVETESPCGWSDVEEACEPVLREPEITRVSKLGRVDGVAISCLCERSVSVGAIGRYKGI